LNSPVRREENNVKYYTEAKKRHNIAFRIIQCVSKDIYNFERLYTFIQKARTMF
jgi:hypothetical protein